jgi:hypothetical protein
MPTHLFATLVAVASAGVQFVLFLRWLHRRMRDDEINRAFVRDVALNHLPHIYSALQCIAQRQGIEIDPAPVVRFVDLHHGPGGNGGHHSTGRRRAS